MPKTLDQLEDEDKRPLFSVTLFAFLHFTFMICPQVSVFYYYYKIIALSVRACCHIRFYLNAFSFGLRSTLKKDLVLSSWSLKRLTVYQHSMALPISS